MTRRKSLFWICILFGLGYFAGWMNTIKPQYLRVNKQQIDQTLTTQNKNNLKPNPPECKQLSKLLTLIPKRFKDDDIIKVFKKTEKCTWFSNSAAHTNFRAQLTNCCNAIQNFTVTQVNTALGANLTYDAQPKKKITITENIFNLLPQTEPFKVPISKRCAVVGNGGILTNSSCGEEIDQADFVFRCNLAPIIGREDDVGSKTDLVTANPSIFSIKYQNLNFRRKPFWESTQVYGKALILLPAFAYSAHTNMVFKVSYTLEDFGSKLQPIYLNPSYMVNITQFWKSVGVTETRLSSGLIVLSAALELCDEVWLYGFWPFSKNMEGMKIFNHYYDNIPPKRSAHVMPREFYRLLQLHTKGILKLRAGKCKNKPTDI
ncbi:alpha-2,8-sialyltransferase 8F [Callorhinchus milii]|uniref:ST8 alpha-N-acetyl-neuraminide alpha-2,8-sialyltransferase 6 n=1 Tax=Callorhinchus milii TaxID=7868 RepID=A0A4W3JNA2_CALMI|nr:alpha-2,8-sialyltransferase 8F [Callorhinchus milii]|eukprot:gi/632960757/ref/XP_007896374.1/ PREDICTED: alpha-2,8-sialyltransferase 8F-like [Callorhinchus milii]